MRLLDAQQALGFITPAFYEIERTIYEVQYPSFDYASLVPVITAGSEWARGTVFSSMDMAGKAEWLNGAGFDMPYADISRSQFVHGFAMAGIGYEWNLEEVSVAALEGISISDAKARAARRIAEAMLYNVALTGDAQRGWTGLLNDASVPAADVAANGTGSVTWWAAKTAAQIIDDIDGGILGMYSDTLEVELANTLLLPTQEFARLNRLTMPNSDTTVLQFIRQNNAYTQQTGQPLLVRGIRSLATADPGGDGRAVLYNRDPDVVRFHLPMPHRFLPPFQKASMTWEVAGILRTGGTEVRRPKAMRYLDGIYNAP